jgi:hypothetical protein
MNNMKSVKTLIRIAAAVCCLFTFQNPACAQTWTASTNAPNKEWWAVASSVDGTKLVAAIYAGGIYTSTNSGQTWISNNVPKEKWWSVASSADGTKLFASINEVNTINSRGIYSSTNAGGIWTLSDAPSLYQSWHSVVCSTDGTKLVAAGAYVTTGINTIYPEVYTSGDSGNAWTLANLPNLNWASVACSADGTKLVALAANTNIFYSSSDSGTTWVADTIPNNDWYSLASSADEPS